MILGAQPTTMSAAIARLGKNGDVSKNVDSTDQRKSIVRLSAQGKKCHSTLVRRAVALIREALLELDTRACDDFAMLLAK